MLTSIVVLAHQPSDDPFFVGLLFFLIGGKLLYNVVLVSAIQQCNSAIISYKYIYFLLEPSSPEIFIGRKCPYIA